MILEETSEREKLYRFAGRFLRSQRARAVVDVACGDGAGARILAEETEGEITGVDRDTALIRRAEEKKLERCTFVAHDALCSGIPSQSFDAAVSFHTLEHFGREDQQLFLSELMRVLKLGAWLLLATPDRDVWELQGIAGTQKDHLRELSREEADRLLQAAGFRVHETYGQELLRSGNFLFRRLLNVMKRCDVLKIRRLLGERTLGRLDQRTQPVIVRGDVVPLDAHARASINIFVCRKEGVNVRARRAKSSRGAAIVS